MSLFIASLNSGSNGNCYYVGNHSDAVLIDAGLSCKETEVRMQRLGLSMNKVKAIFISHEHSDHIKGVEILSKKYHLPVFVTDATRRQGRIKLDNSLSRIFDDNLPIVLGSLAVTAFAKMHDAADPYSFTVSSNEITIGIFTDIGTPCHQLVQHFKKCHAAFLEANYDNEMLENGGYPYFLKSRITGGLGHLSNKQALDLFTMHKPDFMSHLILSHLSKNNNCPKLVNELFNKNNLGVHMIVASRYEASSVFEITAAGQSINKAVNEVGQMAFNFE